MTKSDALIVIERIESNILSLKEGRSEKSLEIVKQLELTVALLKAEVDEEVAEEPVEPVA